MAQLAFLCSIILLAASGTIYAASELYGHGFHWADQVCNSAASFCQEPLYLGAVTGAVVAAYLILRELEV